MKTLYLTFVFAFVASVNCFGQTTLTEDASGNLNTAKVVATTSIGQSFFIGHQAGSGYANSLAIFSALTDNPTGNANYFYDGQTNGARNFYVRADGQGYFAAALGVGTTNLAAVFNVYEATGLGSTAQNSSLLTTVSGSAGTGNNFQNNIWLVRNASGSDWYTTRLHDGISIDGSFQTPQVNTCTWWERDPSQNIQSWGNGASTYMSIHNGNVGIGTVDNANWQLGTSTYKLAVNGSIVATSITVKANANWPDYVFKPTYKLTPLSELKEYVNKNSHLPNFPSAADIATKGLNLGETDKLLIKKVEELTLYLIEKDEQVKSQQLQLDTQQQMNTQQAQQLQSQQEQINLLIKQVAQLSQKTK